jgi:nucleoside-diphosphate-sugar epimerase
MKKAIVTGATGFIGSAFVNFLLRRDIQVLALGRKTLEEVVHARRRKLEGASYLQIDMSEINLLSDFLQKTSWEMGEDCVFFNLAWGGVRSLSDLNVAAQIRNVAWTISAMEVAHRIGCTRFLHVGTMEEAFTEKYLELDYLNTNKYNRHVIYSVAKIVAKNALKVKADQLGMPFIYVNHSHVMGPDDDKDSFLQVTLQKLISGDELAFSTGEQYFDVVSVDDCCLGYYLICKKGKVGETYWVGSGDPKRLREYVERMYKIYPSNKKMEFGKIPYNDIVLEKEVFSITNLEKDTGYKPSMTYEQTVSVLYKHLTLTHKPIV